MCQCVADLEAKIKDKCAGDYRKPIERVCLAGKVLALGDGKIKMTSTFNINLEGKKKVETINVHQAFCPFCGEKQ